MSPPRTRRGTRRLDRRVGDRTFEPTRQRYSIPSGALRQLTPVQRTVRPRRTVPVRRGRPTGAGAHRGAGLRMKSRTADTRA
jgi:hypothetical protein